MKRKFRAPARSLTLAALLASCLTIGTANATLILVGGSAGTIPEGASNEVLEGANWDGWFGANLYTDAVGELQFEFIGFEAGYANRFWLNLGGWTEIFYTETLATNNAGTITSPIGQTYETWSISAGLVPFAFTVNNNSAAVINGSNPDDFMGGAGINFFASFGDSYATNGHSVWIFLDDAGAGPDDNHDDMVIRITQVSEPTSLALIGIGLIALGSTRRRINNKINKNAQEQ